MTTIKIKFRPSSVEGRPGTVYYRVSHRRCTKLITTHIRMLPYQWELLQKSVKQVVDKEWWYYTRRQLESDQNLLMQVVRMFDALGTEYSVNDVIKQYFEARKQIPFFEFMERQIAELLESGHRGTARGYRRSLSSFATYLENNDIAFGMIDERLVMEYSDWLLRRGVVRNTVSFYMRNLRSVYNKAVKQALEPVLSQNITQSQMPINNQLITIIIKSKYYRISLAISIFGCIFGCRISNTPSHEHQTKHHFCT